MEFNQDGSLKTGTKVCESQVEIFEEDNPCQTVLKLINELDFPVGRKMLSSILKGESDQNIKKFRFNFCENFGALDMYDSIDIYELFDSMMSDGFIEIQKTRSSKYYPIVCLTDSGKQELKNPTTNKENSRNFIQKKELFKITEISEKDREIFSAIGSFLDSFNEEQKKAIIENKKRILCVAGAGSGKTTVLTKKIEFLTRIKHINPEKILAITFTRKARQEMISRLQNIDVEVETFNSFCEKLLRKNEILLYSRKYEVMDFKWKIRVFREALHSKNYTPEDAIRKYYQDKTKGKDQKTLFFGLMNDIFSLMDHYKNNMRDISLFKEAIVSKCNTKDAPVALFVYNVIEEINRLKNHYGLRDYTDQIVHCIDLFEKHQEKIPEYEYILVDEYQDVNDLQVKLIDIMNPENLFVVGDPRQSIYGWRGSKIRNILNFPEKYSTSEDDCSVVQLIKNYRSTKSIIEIANDIIKQLGFPEIKPGENSDNNDDVAIIKHSDENSENVFVAQSILSQQIPLNEIFVLARTNKQVESISEVFANYGIKYIAKTGEDTSDNLNGESTKEDHVTISTVHAIKGMEADIVYIIGTNTKMYPCMVSEHPVQDLAKIDYEYDKYDEELRLLYVAITRARKKVFINYSGRLSKFIPDKVQKKIKIINTINPQKSNLATDNSDSIFEKIREWRLELARKKDVPAFMIMSDKIIHQIELRKPATLNELEEIIGFKRQQYAEDIYKVLWS